MKGMITMKKILKILGIVVILFVVVIIYISYIIDHNNQQFTNLTKEISKNYNTNEKIVDSNQYGNFYIIKTKTKVIVLTKDYKEVTEEELSNLKVTSSNLPLIYKTNKLMYEETITKNKKVTYKYYDALSGEKIKSTTLELK